MDTSSSRTKKVGSWTQRLNPKRLLAISYFLPLLVLENFLNRMGSKNILVVPRAKSWLKRPWSGWEEKREEEKRSEKRKGQLTTIGRLIACVGTIGRAVASPIGWDASKSVSAGKLVRSGTLDGGIAFYRIKWQVKPLSQFLSIPFHSISFLSDQIIILLLLQLAVSSGKCIDLTRQDLERMTWPKGADARRVETSAQAIKNSLNNATERACEKSWNYSLTGQRLTWRQTTKLVD